MRRKLLVSLGLEDLIDLVMIDSHVEQKTSVVLEVLLAISAGVIVMFVTKVLLEDPHEVRAVMVFKKNHCGEWLLTLLTHMNFI